MIHTLSSQQCEIHKVTISTLTHSNNDGHWHRYRSNEFSISRRKHFIIHRKGILVQSSAPNLIQPKNEMPHRESKCLNVFVRDSTTHKTLFVHNRLMLIYNKLSRINGHWNLSKILSHENDQKFKSNQRRMEVNIRYVPGVHDRTI